MYADGTNRGNEADPAAHRQNELIEGAWRQVRAVRDSDPAQMAFGRPVPFLTSGTTEADLPADSFTGYEILQEIHRGGQGVVYQALQKSTKRTVAIKVMKDGPFAGAADKARFEREVELLGRLQHPSIVAIHDSGSAAGHFYFVMDYIAGQPLDVYMAGGPRSVEQTLRLFAEVCDAVAAAHVRGIMHRDLKPGNIRIDEQGRPHVLDFGLAKAAADENGAMTATGQFVGSLPWAAPEQVEARPGLVDVRTDVYALGVILYQMLTGKLPYEVAGNAHELMDRILHQAPVRPGALRRQINDEIDTIVLRCLSKERERRYQSAGEIGRDIRRYLAGQPIEAKRDSGWYLLRKTIERHRYAVGAVSMVISFAVIFTISTLLQAGQVARQRDRAVSEAEKAQAMQGFLESMFAAVAPENTPWEDFTVRAVLDDGARRVEAELGHMPETAADIHETLGTTYNSLGLNAEAVRHLNRALELRRSVFGPEHLAVADTLATLAGVLHDKQDVHEAAATAREALAMRQRLLPPEHADIAASMDALAYILVQLNELAEAEGLARSALEIRRRLFPETSVPVATSMLTLGACLRDLGRYEAAEDLLRGALDVAEQLQGPGHTTGILTHLAELLRLKGDFGEAEAVLREVIGLRRRLLGDDHPALAWNLFSLCRLFWKLDKNPDEAEALCREALAIQRASLPPEHPDLPQYMFGLADVLERKGAYDEADSLRREGDAICRVDPEGCAATLP